MYMHLIEYKRRSINLIQKSISITKSKPTKELKDVSNKDYFYEKFMNKIGNILVKYLQSTSDEKSLSNF